MGQQISDQTRSSGGLCQAKMAVAKGIDHPICRAGAADGGQAVGQRWAKAEPLLAAVGLQSRQKATRLGQHRVGALVIRWQFQPAQFDRPANAYATRQPRDHKTMAAKCHLGAQIEGIGGPGGVIACLLYTSRCV